MKKNPINNPNYAVFGLTFILLACAPAFAQLDRSFVATTGVDSAACGASGAPCRNFAFALTRTNGGGEVVALDSGIYDNSNIFIDKSVTLAAVPGVHAELYNASVTSNRITVSAASSDTVILRNLFIVSKAGNTGGYGVGVLSVGTLQIENCVIDRFSQGIGFSMSNSAQVLIKDTIVKNSSTNGVVFSASAGLIKATIDHSHFDNNGTVLSASGVYVLQRGRVTVRDSVASGNTGSGFMVSGGDLNIENCEASNNDLDGVIAQGENGIKGTATVSNTIVTNNSAYGFRQIGGGVFNSLGNNTVRRNATNLSGTITVISGN